MAVSGVSIPHSIVDQFNDLKLKKKYRYMLITLDPTGTKLDSKAGNRNADFASFKKEFSSKECVFGVFDSPTSNKLIFVHWNPDNAPVKSKMSSASAAKAVQESLEGLGAMVQVTDFDELSTACQ